MIGQTIGQGIDMLKNSALDLPDYQKVNLTKEQANTIAGNIANLAASTKLAKATNAANQSMMLNSLRKIIPNYDQIQQNIQSLYESHLKGQLDSGTIGSIRRNAATQSVYGGFSGGGMGRNLEARDLGLTSLQLASSGASSLQNWMRGKVALENPQMMSVQSMFLSPSERIASAIGENQFAYNAEVQKQAAKWSTNPRAHLAENIGTGVDQVMEMIMQAKGGGGGGGGFGSFFGGGAGG